MESSGSIVMAVIGLVVFLLIFLVLREVMLWYWKINIVVEKLDSIHASIYSLNEANRKQSRITYYKAKALGNKQLAYESLLEIVMDELLAKGLKKEERRQKFDALKLKYSESFEALGYTFPDYNTLYD